MTISSSKGYYSVAPKYRSNSLPEALDITWEDSFFQDDDDADGIVAVFDFDYDKIISFNTQLKALGQLWSVGGVTAWCFYAFYAYEPLLALIPLVVYSLTLSPCLLVPQVRWEAYAQHVVVTRDGIRFVQDKRKSCWGLSVCDLGKHSKTVPFDKITDCDIVEPAGSTCLVVPNVLMVVNVDTASSGGETKLHELVISGLKNAKGFKKLVWGMKRAKEAGGSLGYQAPASSSEMVDMTSVLRDNGIDTKGGCTDANSHDIVGILNDIRDELRQNNELLRKQRTNDDAQKPTLQIV